MIRKLFLAFAALGLASSNAAHAQQEETARDRAKLAIICGPALDLTLSRFEQSGLYDVQNANPDVHDTMLRILKLAQMGMTNYKLFSSFAVAKSTGQSSSEVADGFKTAEAQARADFNRFPAGRLPVQVQPVIDACVKSIYRHDKAIGDDAAKKPMLDFFDMHIPLYFPEAQ